MTEDKKQNEEITQAGAVELEENTLDQASGGGSADPVSWKLDPVVQKVEPVVQKVDPISNKYNPVGWKL